VSGPYVEVAVLDVLTVEVVASSALDLDGTEVTSVQGTRIVSSYVTSVDHGDGTWYSTVLPVVLYTILYYYTTSSSQLGRRPRPPT